MFVSEEKRIADKIKDFIKGRKPKSGTYIMLRDGRILSIDEYFSLYDHDKVKPQDAYVYIDIDWTDLRSQFYYPFLIKYTKLPAVYLSKFGFYYEDRVVPATGLKYIAFAVDYGYFDAHMVYLSTGVYLSIQISDLLPTINNLNLPKIAVEVLDGKIISWNKELTFEEYEKIQYMFEHQKLFAGHDFVKAVGLIHYYYDEREPGWAIKAGTRTEVARVAMDYDRIFRPFKVCYETNKWKEVDCRSVS